MNTLSQPRTFKLNFAYLQASGKCFTVWENGQICICDEIIVENDLTFTCNDENDVFLVETYNDDMFTLFTEVQYKIECVVYGRETKLYTNRENAIDMLSQWVALDTITIAARLDRGYEWDANPSAYVKNFSIVELNK
ncbi:hypothetical protein NVP3058O_139 [Vibrio phage 3.058.O._10N.286.46.B8]|nr:hypothetical protein NVP2058O_140 [Vibrio phage 2.058.O._10N.286.46.B8]AUS03209.1 hypothetical protein NVP3058O_139 [Vibrio phage 3.058.O._10N.286.46.B8]